MCSLTIIVYYTSMCKPTIAAMCVMHVCMTCIEPISPVVPSVSESVCTEWISHDSLHSAMLQGMTEMLYTVPGSSEVTMNDAVPFNVKLCSY